MISVPRPSQAAIAFAVAACLLLGGCAGGLLASQAPTIINAGLDAYRASEVFREGDNAFIAEENPPPPADLELLRRASTLAIYPTFAAADGRVVDTARESLSLEVIEPSATVRWVQAQDIPVGALSREEKVARLADLGEATDADLVILTEPAGVNTIQSGFPPTTTRQYVYDTLVVATAPARAVWQERHAVAVDDPENVATADTQRVLVEGIARRLDTLRDPTTAATSGTS